MRIRCSPFLAVEVLAHLATCSEERPGKSDWLACAIHRSLSYTEALMAQLRRAGFVRARKGAGGGYFLNRRPDEIAIADVFRAFDEERAAGDWFVAAMRKPWSAAETRIGAEPLFDGLRGHIQRYLAGVSLADVTGRCNGDAVADAAVATTAAAKLLASAGR
jgi:Rrf2 family iron-sulfur cluster assembly transcriptional regulator